MELSGTGRVLGEAAEVALDQRFDKRGAYTSRGHIRTTATRESLLAFGLDFSDIVDIAGRTAVDPRPEVRPAGGETIRVLAAPRDPGLLEEDPRWPPQAQH